MEKNREKIWKASLKKSNFSGDVTLLLTLEKNAILLKRFCQQLKESASLNKIKPTKATRYALSLINWTNHSKKVTRMSLRKPFRSIWPSSRDVLRWDNIWKWNQLNGRFKWWLRCASSNGCLYELDLYLRKKQKVKVNLGESVVMQLSGKAKGTFCTLFLLTFSIAHYW